VKNFIVTHAEDVDGIISAVLLEEYCKNGENQYFFVKYSEQIKCFLEVLKKVKATFRAYGNFCFISDLSFNQNLLDGFRDSSILGNLSSFCPNIFWFDHHDNTIHNKSRLESFGIIVFSKMKTCSSKIIFEVLFNIDDEKDKKFRYLSDIAQAHDYGVLDSPGEIISIALDLQKVISYINCFGDKKDLLFLIKLLHNRIINYSIMQLIEDNWIFGKIKEYDNRLEEAKIAMINSFTEKNLKINGEEYSFLFAYDASSLLQSKDTFRDFEKRYLQNKKYLGVLIIFGKNICNSIFFSFDKIKFSAVSFCEYMGGGGREGDGGFNISLVNENNIKEKFEEVFLKLKNFLA